MRNAIIGCLIVVVLVLIGGLLFVACRGRLQQMPAPTSVVTSQPTITITWPQNGARVKVGQPFQVHAIATDPRGIFSIGIAVDGQPGTPGTASPPITTFSAVIPITFQTKGVHTIAVQANSTTGAKSEPATIRVVAAQALSDPPAAGDPPTPVPQVSSGPPPPPPPDQPTPPPGATISFVANPTSIQQGQCSTLRWDVDGVREIYFEGVGVTGHEERQQCPTQTTTYTLRVVFTDGSAQDYTATVTVGTNNPNGPTAPVNLRVTSATTTSARIAWDDRSDNEDGFEIQIEGMQSYSAGANVTQYEITGLDCNRSYNFSIRAFNSAGKSAFSNQVTAQTLACNSGGPAAPTNLRVTSMTKTSARITWTDNSNNETGFEIGIGGMPSLSTNANTTQYEAAGLTCNKTYTFGVRAVNAAGVSAWSNQVSGQTLACDGAFAITNVSVRFDPSSYSGPCPGTVKLIGDITSSGPGSVIAKWVVGTPFTVVSSPINVTFARAETKTVTYDLRVATDGHPPIQLDVFNLDSSVAGQSADMTLAVNCGANLAVTKVTASVAPLIFSGICPKTVNYSGVIAANGPGTVTYKWVRSDGESEARTINFAAAGSQTVTSSNVTYNQSATYWAKLQVTAPNAMISDQAKFTLSCTSPAIVTLASVSINPTAFTGPCPHTFHFTGVIRTNAPGTVTYRWERSNGNSDTRTINFSAAGDQTIEGGDFKGGSSDVYWALLHVLTPNDKISNQATFKLTCK